MDVFEIEEFGGFTVSDDNVFTNGWASWGGTKIMNCDGDGEGCDEKTVTFKYGGYISFNAGASRSGCGVAFQFEEYSWPLTGTPYKTEYAAVSYSVDDDNCIGSKDGWAGYDCQGASAFCNASSAFDLYGSFYTYEDAYDTFLTWEQDVRGCCPVTCGHYPTTIIDIAPEPLAFDISASWVLYHNCFDTPVTITDIHIVSYEQQCVDKSLLLNNQLNTAVQATGIEDLMSIGNVEECDTFLTYATSIYVSPLTGRSTKQAVCEAKMSDYVALLAYYNVMWNVPEGFTYFHEVCSYSCSLHGVPCAQSLVESPSPLPPSPPPPSPSPLPPSPPPPSSLPVPSPPPSSPSPPPSSPSALAIAYVVDSSFGSGNNYAVLYAQEAIADLSAYAIVPGHQPTQALPSQSVAAGTYIVVTRAVTHVQSFPADALVLNGFGQIKTNGDDCFGIIVSGGGISNQDDYQDRTCNPPFDNRQQPGYQNGHIKRVSGTVALGTYVSSDWELHPNADDPVTFSVYPSPPPPTLSSSPSPSPPPSPTLTITTTVCNDPDPSTEVRLTGPWWQWDPMGGPVATSNGDGTWTFTFDPAPDADMEHLLVVDGVQENHLTAPHPDLDGDGYGDLWDCTPVTDYSNYANRKWIVGSGDVTNVYGTCGTCSDLAPPASPSYLSHANALQTSFDLTSAGIPTNYDATLREGFYDFYLWSNNTITFLDGFNESQVLILDTSVGQPTSGWYICTCENNGPGYTVTVPNPFDPSLSLGSVTFDSVHIKVQNTNELEGAIVEIHLTGATGIFEYQGYTIPGLNDAGTLTLV